MPTPCTVIYRRCGTILKRERSTADYPLLRWRLRIVAGPIPRSLLRFNACYYCVDGEVTAKTTEKAKNYCHRDTETQRIPLLATNIAAGFFFLKVKHRNGGAAASLRGSTLKNPLFSVFSVSLWQSFFAFLVVFAVPSG